MKTHFLIHGTNFVFILNNKRLMLISEIIAVYCENNKKQVLHSVGQMQSSLSVTVVVYIVTTTL